MGGLYTLPADVLRGPLLDALVLGGDEAGAAALRLACAGFAAATRDRLSSVARARAARVLRDLLPRYRLFCWRVFCGPCFWDDNPRQVRTVVLRLPRHGARETLFFVQRVMAYRYRCTNWCVTTRPGAPDSERFQVRVKDL